jgi:hypothetical protein
MTKTLTMSLIPTGLGLGLAVLLPAIPASANSREVGVTSTCVAQQKSTIEELLECKFPTLGVHQTLEIQYVSMTCVVPKEGGGIEIYYFEILTTPPNSNSEVPYQLPLTNLSTTGDFMGPNNQHYNTRTSVSAPVKFYEKAGAQPRALIDFIDGDLSNTQCTVSLSGEYKEQGDE